MGSVIGSGLQGEVTGGARGTATLAPPPALSKMTKWANQTGLQSLTPLSVPQLCPCLEPSVLSAAADKPQE